MSRLVPLLEKYGAPASAMIAIAVFPLLALWFHELALIILLGGLLFLYRRLSSAADREDGAPQNAPPIVSARDAELTIFLSAAELKLLLAAKSDTEILREVAGSLNGRFLPRQIDDLADLLQRLINTIPRRPEMLLQMRRLLVHEVPALTRRLEKFCAANDGDPAVDEDIELGELIAALAAKAASALADALPQPRK